MFVKFKSTATIELFTMVAFEIGTGNVIEEGMRPIVAKIFKKGVNTNKIPCILVGECYCIPSNFEDCESKFMFTKNQFNLLFEEVYNGY